MTEKHEGYTVTANALVAKRADILFEIGELEKRVDQLRTELVHLDAVLRMFRPDFAAEALPVRHRRPTKSPYFAHGELTKRIYDAMRIRETVSSFKIAADAMRDKGLDPVTDPTTRTDFVRRVTLQLNDMVRKARSRRSAAGARCDGRWPKSRNRMTRVRLSADLDVLLTERAMCDYMWAFETRPIG